MGAEIRRAAQETEGVRAACADVRDAASGAKPLKIHAVYDLLLKA